MDLIHKLISISATLKIQMMTLEVKTGSSRHIWGAFRKEKKNELLAKTNSIIKDATERLLIYKDWKSEGTNSTDYRREIFRTNQHSTERLSLEERHRVQPQSWEREG